VIQGTKISGMKRKYALKYLTAAGTLCILMSDKKSGKHTK
jgi:hypothetical protein